MIKLLMTLFLSMCFLFGGSYIAGDRDTKPSVYKVSDKAIVISYATSCEVYLDGRTTVHMEQETCDMLEDKLTLRNYDTMNTKVEVTVGK